MSLASSLSRKLPGYSTSVYIPKAPPPEAMYWYWNPGRVDIQFAPPDFLARLHQMDPDLTVTWDKYNEKWLVWMKQPRFQSKYCQGWILLFPVHYADGSYMPLDERVMARLFSASVARWGRGKDYFLAIEREMERDKQKAIADRNDEVKHSAGEYYDHMKIQVSGCGPSNGSKFADHFAG